MMTGRAAARALGGVVGSAEQARLLHRAGAAGPGQRAGGVLLYDEASVGRLADRPRVDEHRLAEECPYGVFVSRLARDLPLDLTLDRTALADQVRGVPALPSLTASLLAARVTAFGSLPWVATLCGLVVLTADLTGFETGPGGLAVFALAAPEPWSDRVVGRWFPTGRGGRSWFLWEEPTARSLRG